MTCFALLWFVQRADSPPCDLEAHMKSKTLAGFLGKLLLLLIASAHMVGQQTTPAQGQTKQSLRYKVVFIGTFGGPNSHFSIFGTHILNNDGSFVGWADDSLPDPFAPDGCWDGDCFVARAFLWKNGEMADLGALTPGFSSDVSWMSSSGLISGEAQTGEVDPSVG